MELSCQEYGDRDENITKTIDKDHVGRNNKDFSSRLSTKKAESTIETKKRLKMPGMRGFSFPEDKRMLDFKLERGREGN